MVPDQRADGSGSRTTEMLREIMSLQSHVREITAERDALRGIVVRQELRIAKLMEEGRNAE
jgi:hypothetical protein